MKMALWYYHYQPIQHRDEKNYHYPPKNQVSSVSTVSTTSKKETAGSFNEPQPRGTNTTGVYPFNHVHESESGHIHEVDDTPEGERLFTQHTAGTYEEIIADGTKTVKVVGDNYELIAGGSNVYVRGNINLTCSGTKRELIEGDYILEVGGDFTRKVGGSEQVKIGAGESGGNLEEEIKQISEGVVQSARFDNLVLRTIIVLLHASRCTQSHSFSTAFVCQYSKDRISKKIRFFL